MSFGKRTHERTGWSEPTTTNRDIAAVINREPRTGKDLGGNGGAGSVVTIAVAAVLVGAAVFGALLFTGTINGSGEIIVANSGLREQVADSCNTGASTELAEEIEVVILGAETEVTPRTAEYLNCLMTRQTQRFCAADERKVIAAELKAYFKYFHKKKERQAIAHSMPMGRSMNKLFEKVSERIKEDTGDEVGITAAHKRVEPDASVISAMRHLVRDGHLSGEDFGWAVPSYIEPHLSDVARERNTCS